MVFWPAENAHPVIEALLLQPSKAGPCPPEFVDNGCSMAPDGFLKPACRVHDWAYHNLRLLDFKSPQWWFWRHEADAQLKLNIWVLSYFYVDENGRIQKRHKLNPRAVWGFVAGRIYFWAVRTFGEKAARAGKWKG